MKCQVYYLPKYWVPVIVCKKLQQQCKGAHYNRFVINIDPLLYNSQGTVYTAKDGCFAANVLHTRPGARYWCTQLKITHSLALVNLFKIRSR